jgi:hypothetical protein
LEFKEIWDSQGKAGALGEFRTANAGALGKFRTPVVPTWGSLSFLKHPSWGLWPGFNKQQGVCHTVALPFTLKSIFKAKEESSKLKYFTIQKI